MAKFQKNNIGFFPKINPINEEVSVDIITAYQIKVNKTPNTVVEIFYNNVKIIETTDNIIDLPEDFIDFSVSNKILVKTYKKVFNFIMKGQDILVVLKTLTCCSEDEGIVLVCSDKLACI